MKMTTKQLVAGALLTGLAILIPMIVPIKVVMPPFSATLFSHVPLILAMFINPVIAVLVALASALGFLSSLGPIVAARAAMHVFFVVAGAIMVKKNCNVYVTLLVTMVLHTLSDMLIVALLCGLGLFSLGQAMSAAQTVIAIGTSIHHVVDYAIALLIYMVISKTNSKLFLPLRMK